MPDFPYRPCVGVVLANPEGFVFVGERLDLPGAWQMPQGGIDDDETPEDAALRELAEETGVPARLAKVEAQTPDWIRYDLPSDLVGKVWKGRYRGQEQKWFLIRFQGKDSDIRVDLPHPEFSQWKWSSPEDVLREIVGFKRPVYEEVLAQFTPLL